MSKLKAMRVGLATSVWMATTLAAWAADPMYQVLKLEPLPETPKLHVAAVALSQTGAVHAHQSCTDSICYSDESAVGLYYNPGSSIPSTYGRYESWYEVTQVNRLFHRIITDLSLFYIETDKGQLTAPPDVSYHYLGDGDHAIGEKCYYENYPQWVCDAVYTAPDSAQPIVFSQAARQTRLNHVNSSGQITGLTYTSETTHQPVVTAAGGTNPQLLSAPSAELGQGVGLLISDNGRVLARWTHSLTGEEQYWLSTDGSLSSWNRLDFSKLKRSQISVKFINAQGQLAGVANNPGEKAKAWVTKKNGAHPYLIEKYISTDIVGGFSDVDGLNDAGQLLLTSTSGNRVFVLTPVK